MLSQEARFLEGREARLTTTMLSHPTRSSQRQGRRNNNKTQQELRVFLAEMKQELRDWENRLDALVLDSNKPRTAVQRKHCDEQLEELLQQLYLLKRTCLTTSADHVVVELPPADVRLLHDEFTTLATKLEYTRETLLPPTKFTFKRYRAAMKERQQEQNKIESSSTQANEVHSTIACATPRMSTVAGCVVERLCDSSITVDSNGSYTVQKIEETSTTCHEQVDMSSSSSSLLLRDLNHCNVVINATYKALHLQNVSSTAIRVLHPIDGAIHVTACCEMELYGSCHQLRIHECKQAKFHVKVQSAPILEDSTGIVFFAPNNKKDDVVYDAKDFNWLRNGVPSPNFEIVQETTVMETECAVEPDCSVQSGTTVFPAPTTDAKEITDHDASTNVENDNDEDEL